MACVLLVAGPVLGSEHRVEVEPDQPTEDQAFRLLFSGFLSAIFLGQPEVEVNEGTLRIVQGAVGLGIIDPPHFYAFTAEVPATPAGTYDVELYITPFYDPDGSENLLATGTVEVVPALTIEAIEATPISQERFVPTSREPFRIAVGGLQTCAEIEEPVEVDDQRLIVRVRDVSPCPIPPIFLEITTQPIGPLPAGEYEVIVPLRTDVPVGQNNIRQRSTFRIHPDPVPVLSGRFLVEVEWGDFDGKTGRGIPVRPAGPDLLGEASTLFWFFEEENWELLVKVLDGCAINGHYWVFGAASTDVEYTITVTDTLSGTSTRYENTLGNASPAIDDTAAFPCG